MYNLPLRGMNVIVGRAIGRGFGKCITVDADVNGMCHGVLLRVRVLLDISKPLRRGGRVQLGDGMQAVEVDERLPYFCYGCGVIGHYVAECLIVEVREGNGVANYRYGDFLRGPSHKFASQKIGSSRSRNREDLAGLFSRRRGPKLGHRRPVGDLPSSEIVRPIKREEISMEKEDVFQTSNGLEVNAFINVSHNLVAQIWRGTLRNILWS